MIGLPKKQITILIIALSSIVMLDALPKAIAAAPSTGPANPPSSTSPIISVTLDEALQEALSYSPRVQQSRAQADEARWRRVEALGSFLPQLSISANHFFDIKYQVLDVSFGPTPSQFPLVFPETSATLNARITLFDGLQNINHYEAANRAQDAAELDFHWTEFQTQMDITLKFYQALAAAKLAVVADQNLKTLEDHLSKVRVRRSGGVATRFDVLRIEVQMNEARSEKLFSEDNVIVARSKLTESIGIGEDNRILKGDLPVPTPSKIDRVSREDFFGRRDLTALHYKAEAADRRQAEASAYWVPKVSLGYEYAYYNNIDYSLSTPFRDSHSFGIFINWNIFDGAISYARHQEAASQTIEAETANHSALLKFKTDFEFWRRRFLYSTDLYQAKIADVDKAYESVRLATEGMKAGSQTSSDVLDAELDLFRARAGAVTAQLNAAEALINLQLVIGRKI